MTTLLIIIGSYIIVTIVLLYLVNAFLNAKSGVAFYEDMVKSYIKFCKSPIADDHTLATLIKHRRTLKRARKYSWPFTIRTDRTIIDNATEEEKRLN